MVQYILPHEHNLEPARLRLMGMLLDPFTRQQIQAVGLSPGWRCLEVGSGLGTVSQWLAQALGTSGSILCTDLNPDLLAGMAGPNLEVQALDLMQSDIPGDQDLVLARAVLHHLPFWRDVLPRLVAALKPGGVLLVVEPDLAPGLAQPVVGGFWQAWLPAPGQVGRDLLIGPKLPPALIELGLERVGCESICPIFNGGSAWARYWQMTFDVLAYAFEGPMKDVLQRVRALYDNPDFWTVVSSWNSVWGYKPR